VVTGGKGLGVTGELIVPAVRIELAKAVELGSGNGPTDVSARDESAPLDI
jgi:hypothetical protein